MDIGAEAEILSLLDLPTSAPEIWQLLTAQDNASKHVSNGAPQSKSKMSSPGDVLSADARVPMLTA